MNLCTKKPNIIVAHARGNFKLIRIKARRENIEEIQKEQLWRERFSKVYGSYINIFYSK